MCGQDPGHSILPREGGQMPLSIVGSKRRCQTPFSKGLHSRAQAWPLGPQAFIPSLLPPTYWSSAVSWESACSSCDSEGWEITGAKPHLGIWGFFWGGWLGVFGHTVGHTGSWFPDRGQTLPPAGGAWSSNHWTREVPGLSFHQMPAVPGRTTAPRWHAPIHRALCM